MRQATGDKGPRRSAQDVNVESSLFLAIIQTILLAIVAGALIAGVSALRRMTARIESSLSQTEDEITATLRQGRATLERIEKLAQASHQLLREDVTPTLDVARSMLSQVETAGRGISDTFDGVERVVKGVAAISGPGALAVVTQRLFKRGKLGLLAFGVGAGLRAFFSNGIRRNR